MISYRAPAPWHASEGFTSPALILTSDGKEERRERWLNRAGRKHLTPHLILSGYQLTLVSALDVLSSLCPFFFSFFFFLHMAHLRIQAVCSNASVQTWPIQISFLVLSPSTSLSPFACLCRGKGLSSSQRAVDLALRVLMQKTWRKGVLTPTLLLIHNMPIDSMTPEPLAGAAWGIY